MKRMIAALVLSILLLLPISGAVDEIKSCDRNSLTEIACGDVDYPVPYNFMVSGPDGSYINVMLSASGDSAWGSMGPSPFPQNWPLFVNNDGYQHKISIPEYESAACTVRLNYYYSDSGCTDAPSITYTGTVIETPYYGGSKTLTCKLEGPGSFNICGFCWWCSPQRVISGSVSFMFIRQTCADYCKTQTHEDCPGSWTITGENVPSCLCEWSCDPIAPTTPEQNVTKPSCAEVGCPSGHHCDPDGVCRINIIPQAEPNSQWASILAFFQWLIDGIAGLFGISSGR